MQLFRKKLLKKLSIHLRFIISTQKHLMSKNTVEAEVVQVFTDSKVKNSITDLIPKTDGNQCMQQQNKVFL